MCEQESVVEEDEEELFEKAQKRCNEGKEEDGGGKIALELNKHTLEVKVVSTTTVHCRTTVMLCVCAFDKSSFSVIPTSSPSLS